MSAEYTIDTDVLVVGGGMAGMVAAIKAKEQGLDVTIVDKAYIGKAGSTHFSEGDIVFFRPQRGHKIKEWLDMISRGCEYVNNREWDEICLNEAEDRYNDLVSWGVQFYERDGKLYIFGPPGGGRRGYEAITQRNRKYAPTLRKKVIECGVRVIDRIMLCELLKQDGAIAGAIGFHTTSGDLYIFNARSIILATGATSLKAGAYPIYSWTGDGEAMAYRTGAEVVSKEFMYGMSGTRESYQRRRAIGKVEIHKETVDASYRFPFAIGGDYSGWYNAPNLNAEGGPVIFPAWEAHEGRAPLYIDLTYSALAGDWFQEYFKRIGTPQAAKIGLDAMRGGQIKWPASRVMTNSVWNGSGVWAVDKSCSVGIPGLYAAGNSCGTMASGAAYGGMGFASNHAMVTGTRAALGCAEYGKSKAGKASEAELNRAKEVVLYPMERQGGFSPDWVTQVLHGVTVPYFFLDIKHETRLQAALTVVEFLKEHIVPKLMANDAHEWRMAHETRNLVLVAEMRLRASLFRTESRGNHFREDYPRRDDPNWLAWVKLKEEEGAMKMIKTPIPREWWPDLSKPYEELYPRALPLEKGV